MEKASTIEVINGANDDKFVTPHGLRMALSKNGGGGEQSKIVHQQKLTAAANTIHIDGLDIVRDGGVYEISINGRTSIGADCPLYLNGISTGYYQMGKYSMGTATADGNTSYVSGFRVNKSGFYYAHSMRPNATNIQGRLTLPADRIPHYSWKAMCVWSGNQVDSDGFGILYQEISNITKISITARNANFQAGTEVIIRKI